MKKLLSAITCVVGTFAVSVNGAEWLVPQDYPTIQEAVDAAADGDTVTVAPGEYVVRDPIDFNPRFDPRNPESPPVKNITLRSSAGPEQTIIRFFDNTGVKQTRHHNAMKFASGETSESLLEGFTLTGGEFYSTTGWGSNLGIPGPAPYLGGGGVAVVDSSPMIRNCIISENGYDTGPLGDSDAYLSGGGVYCSGANARPVFENCTITDNGGGLGGGIYLRDCFPTFKDCVITGNRALRGGGVYAYDGTSPLFIRCTIRDNRAESSKRPEGSGGGVYIRSVMQHGSSSTEPAEYPVFRACTIEGNVAEFQGGGVLTDRSRAMFDQCKIIGNVAAHGGGGVSSYGGVYSGAFGLFFRCDISWNSAESGGGIYGGGEELVNCRITQNVGGAFSGTWWAWGGKLLVNCIVTGNRGSEAPVGIYGADIINCTIVGNSGARIGGNVVNSIIWNNGETTIGTTNVSYSCIEVEDLAAFAGEGNINTDPLLGSQLRPTMGSPVIDAGNNDLADLLDEYDLDGDGDTLEPLPFDVGGGYRFWDEISVADTGVGSSPIVDMGAHEFRLFEITDLKPKNDQTVAIQFSADEPRAGETYRLMSAPSPLGPWSVVEGAEMGKVSERAYRFNMPGMEGMGQSFFRLLEVQEVDP